MGARGLVTGRIAGYEEYAAPASVVTVIPVMVHEIPVIPVRHASGVPGGRRAENFSNCQVERRRPDVSEIRGTGTARDNRRHGCIGHR